MYQFVVYTNVIIQTDYLFIYENMHFLGADRALLSHSPTGGKTYQSGFVTFASTKVSLSELEV